MRRHSVRLSAARRCVVARVLVAAVTVTVTVFAAVGLAPTPAHAEPGLFMGHVGGGPSVTWRPLRSAPDWGLAPRLQTTLGLSESLNWEGLFVLDFARGGVAALPGTGLDVVLAQSNHWRVSVGPGVAAAVPVDRLAQVDVGAWVHGAVRWLPFWGTGLSLETHALWMFGLDDATSGAVLYPALNLYTEY